MTLLFTNLSQNSAQNLLRQILGCVVIMICTNPLSTFHQPHKKPTHILLIWVFLLRSGNNLSAGLVNLETSIATEKGEKEEEKTIVAVVLANALVIRYD